VLNVLNEYTSHNLRNNVHQYEGITHVMSAQNYVNFTILELGPLLINITMRCLLWFMLKYVGEDCKVGNVARSTDVTTVISVT